MLVAAVLLTIALIPRTGFSQSNPALETFFRQNIGFTDDQVSAIRSGQAVSKVLPSRIPAEVFLLGAVYIHAAPDAYVRFAHDFDRLRKLPSYLALGVFSNPPQLSEPQRFCARQR
jgi:hypothetical protein